MNKDVQQFIKVAQQRGWIFHKHTGSGHYQMRWPGGGAVTFGSTPAANKRSLLNTRAQMLRIEREFPLDGVDSG